MLKRLLVIALAAGALAASTSAVAATDSQAVWTWSKKLAQQTLLNQGLDFVLDDGSEVHETVYYADCKGEGRGVRNRYGVLTFRNFTCYVETDAAEGENAYFIRFHVAGKYRWTYAFLHYADQ